MIYDFEMLYKNSIEFIKNTKKCFWRLPFNEEFWQVFKFGGWSKWSRMARKLRIVGI